MGSQINEEKEERTIFSRSPGGKHTEVTVLALFFQLHTQYRL